MERASSSGRVGAGESVMKTTELPIARRVFQGQRELQAPDSERTTSSAVRSVPSWKRTPGRSQNCQRCAWFSLAQRVASDGDASPFAAVCVSVSKTRDRATVAGALEVSMRSVPPYCGRVLATATTAHSRMQLAALERNTPHLECCGFLHGRSHDDERGCAVSGGVHCGYGAVEREWSADGSGFV